MHNKQVMADHQTVADLILDDIIMNGSHFTSRGWSGIKTMEHNPFSTPVGSGLIARKKFSTQGTKIVFLTQKQILTKKVSEIENVNVHWPMQRAQS